LCFERAFPTSSEQYREASSQLLVFEDRIDALPRAERASLWDSGNDKPRPKPGFAQLAMPRS
jgi:hypothetical protein